LSLLSNDNGFIGKPEVFCSCQTYFRCN